MAAPHLHAVPPTDDEPDDVEQREPLEVGNDAAAADWLRGTLGGGPLAGYFRRGIDVVHTAAIGPAGYLTPPADAVDPAPVRTATVEQVAARVQYTYWPYRMKKSPGGALLPDAAMFPLPAARTALAVPDLLPTIRDLRGVVHTPIVRRDGTILDQPGYDEATQLLYLPTPGLDVPAIPAAPTVADVDQATALLDEMIAGFAFVTDHDNVNYLGLLLTPLLRELCPPPYKLGAIGAPQPGSGKTLLATCARLIHGGVFRSEFPEDDAELRKQITALLDATTGPVVNFDNATGTVRSSVLAGLLTSPLWDDRRLGSTEMVSRPNDRLWLVTGNNLKLGGDLVRRTVWVTIDPGCPDPHLRTEFAITDLEGWVRERRGRLLHALLVLVRAWVVAGKPMTARSGDGYAHWVATVDGILTNAGAVGTFDHADSIRQEIGADDQEWADLLDKVHELYADGPWTAKELLGKVHDGSDGWGRDPGYEASHPIAMDALPLELTMKAKGGNVLGLAKSFGMWLRNRDGRWAGGRTVRAAGKNRDGVGLWRVETSAAKR